MKITYDTDGEMLYIEFNGAYPFRTDSKSVPGMAISYDESGKICAIEIEDATQFVDAPNRVDFEYLTQDESEPTQHAVGD